MSLSRILANIGTALDSASTGDFLSKVDSDGVFGGVAYSSVTGTPTVLDSANITNLIDSAYIQLRQTAVASGGLDSATTISLIDSDYITSRATASGFQMFEYDATAGQTVFTGSDVNGNTLAYSEYGLLVHYNGILLSGATDYTATDGTTVVLTDSADADARITIAKWSLASAGGGAAATWYGDRAVVTGGYSSGILNSIEYFDISAGSGNGSDFGDLTIGRNVMTSAVSNGTYGVFAGGANSGARNEIDYITVSTPSNATDWGDLTQARYAIGGISNGVYGLFAGGATGYNTIDYITFASPGNAVDFGDLNIIFQRHAAASDGTYGLVGGGKADGDPHTAISYITIGTSGSGTDFGDLTQARNHPCACSDNTRVVFCAGYDQTLLWLNIMDYVTSATPSNATDFGDLVESLSERTATSDITTGVISSGRNTSGYSNSIDKITIQTTSNATDFGDLPTARGTSGSTSGSPS